MTETARMYGGSLYDLAAEEGLDERILGELDGVTALLNGDAEYLHLLSIPSIPKKERCALLDEAFRGQVHLYVLNFMKLLCEKGALRELPGCARAYRLRYNEAHGILEATAVSAVPLTAEQTRRLHEKAHRPQNEGRACCAGRHPAGHRRHRAGRHRPQPPRRPAQQHSSSNTVTNTKPSGKREARLLSEPQGEKAKPDRSA